MFEPIHGSAPKYEGKAIVNPVATIESIRMTLEYVGEEAAAQDIAKGIESVFVAGEYKTRDMGGKHKTHEMGDAIKEAVLKAK